MGKLASNFDDPGLMTFIRTLVDDQSLTDDGDIVARRALKQGLQGLSAAERQLLETDVIEPYVSRCEGCDCTPAWEQMLMVYDTGLCSECFTRLEGKVVPSVRPDWMPLIILPDDAELPESAEATLQA